MLSRSTRSRARALLSSSMAAPPGLALCHQRAQLVVAPSGDVRVAEIGDVS
jgi:hypothetical protein